MEYIAHRGAAFDAPENSLAAFARAIDEGADRIELDVQITRDGVPIVCHDGDTARVGNRTVEIEFATLDEVRNVELENGEPIPTLEEVCELAAGRIALDVELKATSPDVAQGVLDILHHHGLLADALITSFDPQVLRTMRVLGFNGRTGLLVGSKSLNVRQRAYEAWPLSGLHTARATELVIHHLLIHRVLRSALEREGLSLVLWTAIEDEDKSEAERARLYRKLARMNVDGIIVSRVEEARRVIAQAAETSGEVEHDGSSTPDAAR